MEDADVKARMIEQHLCAQCACFVALHLMVPTMPFGLFRCEDVDDCETRRTNRIAAERIYLRERNR